MVDMDIATVAVIKLDEDVVGLKVRADHGPGVEVAHLVAPVDSNPPTPLKLRHSSGTNFQDLKKYILNDKNVYDYNYMTTFIIFIMKEDNFRHSVVTNTCED